MEEHTYALAARSGTWTGTRCVRASWTIPRPIPGRAAPAYALGTPNRLISFHPSYLALSPYAKVRQRHYRALLAPSEDPRTDAWDPCWTSQRAVGAEEGQSKAATLVALRFVETSLLRRRPHT